MKSYRVTEEISLKNFTDNTCAQASFCFRALLKSRSVRVNGNRVDRDIPLHRGDEVCYYMTAAQEKKSAFEIVYEDENVIVADKESGVNSEAVFSALKERGEVYYIHRLDRNTAGILIFARTAEAERELLSAFREHRTEKIYLALVVGKMPKQHAVEEAYLSKNAASSTVRISPSVGEKIVTEYEVLSEGGDTSLLKITLHTGKTHQIRAHLAYLGHPVAGDEKYGDSAFNRQNHMTRQRLVAKELLVRCGGALAYLAEKRFLSQKTL